MSISLSCRLKPYIQPFERELAYRELKALARAGLKREGTPEECASFQVRSEVEAKVLVRELAFWETVTGHETAITKQSLREATVNVVRNGVPIFELLVKLPFKQHVPIPNRRCLRYGPHGIHEYRGKFFPQLVRALINIGSVPENGIVADPFSGSGTTMIEAILANRKAIGLDMNPLSVFMGQTKCAILTTTFSALKEAYDQVRSSLLDPVPRRAFASWISGLASEDQEYLKAWFDPIIIRDLDLIASCISSLTKRPIRDFMLLCFSNILRRVSLQKEDDLRVRRELKAVDEMDPVKDFLEELGRSTRLVLALLREEGRPIKNGADIRQGDSKTMAQHWEKWLGKVDAVITSPPYATALPYLDTDRLSLCFLALLNRSKHRDKDREMIGNREITERGRRAFWDEFCANRKQLPRSVGDLITEIYELNQNADVGFRRRNLPSLLYKYFRDMKAVFDGTAQVLKKRGNAFVVIGNNHTLAGGRRVSINTVKLLGDVAEAVGFESIERIDMEMLVSRDIFKKNAIGSESILHLRKACQ
jgi:hypothetical protein